MFFIGLIVSGLVVVRVTSDEPLAAVTLSEVVMSALCLVWVGVFVVGAGGYRVSETYQIKRMFAGEIWECWQFSISEWEAQVESVCNLINPKTEGKQVYSGVIASSIFGAVFAIIMAIIIFFAVKDPVMRKILWITSGVVFLLFVGAGLIQPMAEKNQADRYRRKALRFAAPRVWFGPDDIYHEALGHTSLKGLVMVTDQTKSRQAIQFKRKIKTDESDDVDVISAPVPAGCEEQAGRLVLRYRRERFPS